MTDLDVFDLYGGEQELILAVTWSFYFVFSFFIGICVKFCGRSLGGVGGFGLPCLIFISDFKFEMRNVMCCWVITFVLWEVVFLACS